MATFRFNNHAESEGTICDIFGYIWALPVRLNLHIRGGWEGRRRWCSRLNCRVCDLLPKALWHWRAEAGAQRRSVHGSAKTCHHWSEREGNAIGATMVRGDVGSPVIQGLGGLRARAVRGICHYHQLVPQSLTSLTGYDVKGQESCVRISQWSCKARGATIFFKESLISGIIQQSRSGLRSFLVIPGVTIFSQHMFVFIWNTNPFPYICACLKLI